MEHITPVNRKAKQIDALQGRAAVAPESTSERRRGVALEAHTALPADVPAPAQEPDVVALQQPGTEGGPHIPLGCSFVFAPGWEADSTGSTAGLCQPVERDLFDCYLTCFWPAHVPDLYNHAPDWTAKCAAAQKDWRKIDLIFP